MHPVTRLGRIVQQLRSFADLHAGELEAMAVSLDTAGAADVAAQLRSYRDIQRDEASMVVQELVDVQTDLASGAGTPAVPPLDTPPGDPAAYSPRRAKWLAEQAAEAERLRQPVSRRDLFGKITNREDEDTPET